MSRIHPFPAAPGWPLRGRVLAMAAPTEKIAAIKALVASGRSPAEVCKIVNVLTYYTLQWLQRSKRQAAEKVPRE